MALKSLFLVVEGVGNDATAPNGVAWTFGPPVRHGTVADDYEWHGGFTTGAGLIDAPKPSGDLADPYGVTYSGGALRFELHWDDLAAQLWNFKPLVGRAYLSAEISKSATVLTIGGKLNGAAVGSAHDGLVIWLGEEAVRLGTYAGDSSFSGCTRAYYNTRSAVWKANTLIFTSNKYRGSRACWLHEYNHDTATYTQKWQGFIRPEKPYSVSSKVLTVEAVDLFAGTAGALINRAYSKPASADEAQLLPPDMTYMSGRIRMEPAADRNNHVRVNKRGATRPHFMCFQVAKEGAVWCRKEDNTRGEAKLIGFLGAAPPIRGGSLEEALEDNRAYELLACDREADTGPVIRGAYVSYANRRSSTRDLQYPFNPPSAAAAILMSGFGYGITPGTAGTGEAGSVDSEFGTTVTLAQSKTQYFTGTGNEIFDMDARGLSGQCAIMRKQGDSSTPHVALAPDDGGALVWSMDTTGISSTTDNSRGLRTTSTHVYCLLEREDGTYTAANAIVALRLDITDGSIDWGRGNGFWDGMSRRGIDYAPTADRIAFLRASGTSEIRYHDASDGTLLGDSNDAGNGIGTADGIGWADDETMFFVAGTNEVIGYWTTPYSDDDAAAGSLNFTSGADTTLTWSAFPANGSERPMRIRSDRNGDGAWVCQGAHPAVDEPYVMHITTNSGGTPTVDIEIDVSNDWGFASAGTNNTVRDIAVDQYGHLYVLVSDEHGTGASEYDIVRYDETGTFVYSALADGVTLPTGSDSPAASITVDEDGNIYIGDEDGYLWVWTQT